jgi:hypothetical protein
MESVHRDLDAAARAFQATKRRTTDGAPNLITFASQLQFLLTIGYLTKEQATALVSWFQSSGTMALPALPGPDGIAGPTMYEILSTRIHFGTPPRPGADGALEFDIGDFFSGLVSGLSDLASTVLDGVTDVLQAGTELIHEIHEVLAS